MKDDSGDNSYLAIIRDSQTMQEASVGILKQYFGTNKNRKGRLITDTGLSYSHITKYEQGEFIKKPYYDTVALIFGRHILQKEEFKALTEKYYTEIKQLIDYFKDFPKPADDQVNKLIRDKTGSIIFQLINTREGVSREEIKNTYHGYGTILLNKFLDSGYFKEINGRIKPAFTQTSTMDNETVARLVVNTIEANPVDDWMTELAHIFNLNESLNKEGFNKASDMIANFAIKLKDEVLYNSKYQGTIPASFNLTAQIIKGDESL